MMLTQTAQGLREDWPAVIVHGLRDACAACDAAASAEAVRPGGSAPRGLILQSAPGAGWYGGAGWFLAIARAAATAHPALPLGAVLDCGALPGAVLDALRAGAPAVIFTGPAECAARLAAIATARGALLLVKPPPAHDLATRAGHTALAAALAWRASAAGMPSTTTRADDKAGKDG
ncbi:MAG: hypothetical protein IT557_01620 [Alphaproteobacteria bacterium]|nr:hypothetical protein [Alphaproteobacteria bacterium]